MTKYITMFAVLSVAMLLAAPVQAQNYEGVLADDGGMVMDDDDAGGPASTLDPYDPDYFKKRADMKRANSALFQQERQKEIEAAKKAREEQAKATQEAIDARVKAAVSAPANYDARAQAIKVPPPQVPPPTASNNPTLRALLVEIILTLPVRIIQRRDGAGNRFPFGNRKAGFCQTCNGTDQRHQQNGDSADQQPARNNARGRQG